MEKYSYRGSKGGKQARVWSIEAPRKAEGKAKNAKLKESLFAHMGRPGKYIDD